MLIVPIQPTPNQLVNILLAGQPCGINVYQKTGRVFMDLYVNDVPLITSVICRNRVLIVREAYFGFIGDFVMVDTQGDADPVYTGFGTQYLLYYVESGDALEGLR